MGANIELLTNCLGSTSCRFSSQSHAHSLIVHGPTPLKARNFTVPDLRAGFAYVIAALLAEDVSTISGVHYLERGYANLVENLVSLGADIKKTTLHLDKLEKKLSLTSI
jgi:UDP-N-acetylglucosamine 1-carboxyvinyltransferase